MLEERRGQSSNSANGWIGSAGDRQRNRESLVQGIGEWRRRQTCISTAGIGDDALPRAANKEMAVPFRSVQFQSSSSVGCVAVPLDHDPMSGQHRRAPGNCWTWTWNRAQKALVSVQIKLSRGKRPYSQSRRQPSQQERSADGGKSRSQEIVRNVQTPLL